MGPVDFVRRMEEALIRLCGVYGVQAGRIAGLTGVWCGCAAGGGALDESRGERKIGAIGIHVSRGITSHGFAFNVTTDLDDFRLINPCGITDRPVTSLEREMARARARTCTGVDGRTRRHGSLAWCSASRCWRVESLEALRAQSRRTAGAPARTRRCRFLPRWSGWRESRSGLVRALTRGIRNL